MSTRRLLQGNNALASPALFRYTPGAQDGYTFARADATTCATYFDINGVLQTVAANVLRDNHYVSGVRTTLLECGTRTNPVLWNRDLTNVAWAASNVTPLKNQTGIDGVANSASSITATAGNGTILQGFAQAISTVTKSAYVKRLVGSGTVQVTVDNGATWTTVTVTAGWTRVLYTQAAVTNPTVGFRLVTNGDSIAVDYAQCESAGFATSPIATGATAVVRAADVFSTAYTVPPQPMTLYCDAYQNIATSVVTAASIGIGSNSGVAVRLQLFQAATTNFTTCSTHNGVASRSGANTQAPVFGDRLEQRGVLFTDGSVQAGSSVNGAAENVGTQSATNTPLGSAFGVLTMFIGNLSNATTPAFFAVRSIKIALGVRSLQDMRAM